MGYASVPNWPCTLSAILCSASSRIRREVVIALWFLIWAAALTSLGYSGRHVEQDWGPYRSLWERIRGRRAPSERSESDEGSWWSGAWSLPDFGTLDAGGDGAASALVLILVSAVAAILLFFTIGWVVPFVGSLKFTFTVSLSPGMGMGQSQN